MEFRYIIAILAPLVNCVQLLPQLVRTYQTKHVKDLSLWSLLLILFTNILWFTHGYFIQDMALIISGLISVSINGSLLSLYLFYR